jgi:hypothetical protein
MDFELFEFDKEVENNTSIIESRSIKRKSKHITKSFLKKEKALQILTELPKKDENIHIVSNGSFDYFTLIPILIELEKTQIEHFYFSTWTLNNINSESIIKLFDDGKIKTINCLVGLYFKKRESNVFNFLYENIKERKQKIFANENHSKVTLLNSKENFYTIEGSANFTANPRIEQFTIHNSQLLFEFHKQWMDEILLNNG